MGADPGKSDIPLVRPVDDDAGSVVEDDFLRFSEQNFFFSEDEPLCPDLLDGGREIFEQGVEERGKGRQTQECERFL